MCPAPASERPRPDAIIFDVDGTLCDVGKIRYLVEPPTGKLRFKPNFEQFHSESIDCPTYPRVVEVLKRARNSGLAVLIVTGREEKWSFLTSTWLKENGIAYDELVMRAAKDYRPDVVIKAGIASDLLTRYKLRVAIDDRKSIIGIWQEAGIPTVRVSRRGEVGTIHWPTGAVVDPAIEAVVSGVSPL